MFDAVVIGSGLGGLTAAALLAKAGKKVCVIERNHEIGGAASAFRSGALRIEPSLHQTGNPLDPIEPKHDILTQLGLLDEIEWIAVSPFMSVRGEQVGGRFDLPIGFDVAREALQARFPGSRAGIANLFFAMKSTYAGVVDLTRARAKRSLWKLARGGFELREFVRDWRRSTDEMLQHYLGDDEGAKFAIAGNLAYYTDDPRRLAWPFFLMAQGGFLRSGGVYVKGGSQVLSMKLAEVVCSAGGTILTGREAIAIELNRNGAPAAVRHVETGGGAAEDRIATQLILANCAPNVLTAMLPEPARGACERAYGGVPLSTSLFAVHFGVDRPPAEFGLTCYNEVRVPDWARSLRDIATSATMFAADPSGRMPIYGVANYGAIDSGLSDGGPTLVTAVGADRLDNWAGLTPQQDKDRRARWRDAFQAALDHDYPGFGSAVTERQFLSARSMRDFLNTPDGAVYGFAPLPMKRSIWAGLPRSPRTPVAGIYLASSFAGAGGFTGAMGAGAAAAQLVMAG
jgi:phytoene dehydrogenase-like protein